MTGHHASPSLPVGVQRLLLTCFILTFVAFVHQTVPVRLAHFDDTNANQLIHRNEMEGAMVPTAQLQGRFYLAAPGHFWPYEIYHIDSPLGFATLRAALFFAQIGLLGWLCGRVSRNAALGWMVALFGAAALICRRHSSPCSPIQRWASASFRFSPPFIFT